MNQAEVGIFSMNLQEALFCSIDVETTGLNVDKDEIIAFASLPVKQGKIIVHDAYYTLIKSERYRIESMKFHGIGERDLDKTPRFEEIAPKILMRMNGILVGHTVGFDYGLLKRQFKKIGKKLRKDTIDIVAIEEWLAEKTGRAVSDLTLDGLMVKYGLRSHYRHNAFADAFFTAQIFQFELLQLSRLGIQTTDDLVRIAKTAQKPLQDLAYW
jgi:DNA polymerase-3 subunit epsilon